MTGAVLAVAVLAFLGLGASAIVAMVRHEARWRDEQPSWWRRPIDSPGLRQSVRRGDEPSPYEVVSLRDPRVIGARVTKRKAVGK